MKKKLKIVIAVVVLIVLGSLLVYLSLPDSAFNPIYKALSAGRSVRQVREKMMLDSNRTIKIGVAGHGESIRNNSLYYQGIELAIEEINQSGGIFGVLLESVIEDDEGELSKSLEIAQKFADDPQIAAVIGHWTSKNTLPVAHVYDQAGVILITPTVTNPTLTHNGYKTVFRNTLSDAASAKKLAEYANQQGCRNIAVYYSDSLTGIDLSLSFERSARELGINIIDRHRTFSDQEQFENVFARWQIQEVDAVFIADMVMNVDQTIGLMHELDPQLLVLGADGFDFDNLPQLLGSAAENVAFTSFFTGFDHNQAYLQFEQNFISYFGIKPDYFAVQAYDSVYLFAHAVRQTKNLSPSDLAAALRSDYVFPGVNGNIKFDQTGEIISGNIIIKRVKDGAFVYEKTK